MAALESPLEIICVRAGPSSPVPELEIAIKSLKNAANRGKWIAGFVAYEAAPVFDPAFKVREPEPGAPLLWIGIYDQPIILDRLPDDIETASRSGDLSIIDWRPLLDEAEYAVRHARIRELIAAGDTYQVNLTYPLQAQFGGDPYALFHALHEAQQARYGAYLRADHFAISSASPELLFAQTAQRVITRPMKGTTARGRWLEEDQARAEALRTSAKERAENLMIVDLLRNDLGRIARPGSVRVESLHALERYPTVWQMTSTIAAETHATPLEVLAALFPCGSVTGAPKVRTMEIIAELEPAPRGVYCGAIGFIAPDRRAQFNVAIRTAYCDLAKNIASYGVGGGVTWDSRPELEHSESRIKARILSPETRPRDFAMLESILWEPKAGYFLLDRHLLRLASSAEFFGFAMNLDEVRRELEQAAAAFAAISQKVRLLLHRNGKIELSADPLSGIAGASDPRAARSLPPRSVAISASRVSSSDTFLFHKTTNRAIYDHALQRTRAQSPQIDDVLLVNEAGELSESTMANLVLEIGGRFLTPERDCGLLAGVFREEVLETHQIEEARLMPADLSRASGKWLINSVRRWIPFELSAAPPANPRH